MSEPVPPQPTLPQRKNDLLSLATVVTNNGNKLRIPIITFKPTGKYNTHDFIDIPPTILNHEVRAYIEDHFHYNGPFMSYDLLGVPFLVTHDTTGSDEEM